MCVCVCVCGLGVGCVGCVGVGVSCNSKCQIQLASIKIIIIALTVVMCKLTCMTNGLTPWRTISLRKNIFFVTKLSFTIFKRHNDDLLTATTLKDTLNRLNSCISYMMAFGKLIWDKWTFRCLFRLNWWFQIDGKYPSIKLMTKAALVSCFLLGLLT